MIYGIGLPKSTEMRLDDYSLTHVIFLLFDVDVVKYGFKYGSRDEAERDGNDDEERRIIHAKAKA